MFITIKNIYSSLNAEDNYIPKNSLIPEQLIKPFDNGVFINGAGIYVDDLIFASKTKKIGDQNVNNRTIK